MENFNNYNQSHLKWVENIKKMQFLFKPTTPVIIICNINEHS